MENIIFIGDARDFHAMDWYHSAKDVCYPRKVYFATDLINSEGQEVLIREGDNIINLYNIDWLLFPNQSRFGHIWRNFIKLLFSPFQAIRLKLISKKTPNSIFHAHTMYYMFLCWMARISYFGTPQGSEILVRPNRSKLYRYFAIKALLAARHVTVDSINMQNNIYKLCGKTSSIVQNGIDIIAILHSVNNSEKRINIVSLRGLRPPYQIDEIFKARNHCRQKPPLILIYPFSEEGYKTEILQKCEHNDLDLGRLSRIEMYKLLADRKSVV